MSAIPSVYVSDCCSNPVKADGSCQWCGKSSGTHLRLGDALLKEIRSVLCDWNSPDRLESHELWPNVFKVARLIKKREDPSMTDSGKAREELVSIGLSKLMSHDHAAGTPAAEPFWRWEEEQGGDDFSYEVAAQLVLDAFLDASNRSLALRAMGMEECECTCDATAMQAKYHDDGCAWSRSPKFVFAEGGEG